LGALALLWGALVGAVAILVWYYAVLWRQGLLGLEFSLDSLKKSLVYSLGLLPMAGSAWISGHSDKLLITWLGSQADSGVYSVAFEIGRVLNLFVISLFMVYLPMIYSMLKEDAKKNVARIEQFQSFYFHALVGLAFLVSIFSPEIFRLLTDVKYHDGIRMVPIIAFAFVFGGIRKLYASLIYYHKLTLLIAIGGILLAVLSLGLNVLLIPRFGGVAAAWSKLISMIIVAGYFLLLSRKYEPLRVDWTALGTTLSIFGACLAGLAFCSYVLHLTFWPLLAVKVVLAFLALALTWFSRFGVELRRVLSRRRQKPEPVGQTLMVEDDSIGPSEDV
jgi:O-antigen/teichoic acid export membrane protein